MTVVNITGQALKDMKRVLDLSAVEVIQKINGDTDIFVSMMDATYPAPSTHRLRNRARELSFKGVTDAMLRRRTRIQHRYGTNKTKAQEYELYIFRVLDTPPFGRIRYTPSPVIRNEWKRKDIYAAYKEVASMISDGLLIIMRLDDGCKVAAALAQSVTHGKYKGRIFISGLSLSYIDSDIGEVELRQMLTMSKIENRRKFCSNRVGHMVFPLCYNVSCLIQSHLVYETAEEVADRRKCPSGEGCSHSPKCIEFGNQCMYPWGSNDGSTSEDSSSSGDESESDNDDDSLSEGSEAKTAGQP